MPETSWIHGTQELTSRHNVKVVHTDYATKLSVRMATRKDSGKYKVMAENINGKDIAEVKVTVLGNHILLSIEKWSFNKSVRLFTLYILALCNFMISFFSSLPICTCSFLRYQNRR